MVTRLPEHGIRRANGMEYLSPQVLANAAGEAYQIGKSLGDEVIVVGTSMGGALTLLTRLPAAGYQSSGGLFSCNSRLWWAIGGGFSVHGLSGSWKRLA